MHTYRDKSEQSSLSQTENIKVGETRSSQREYDDNAQLARLGKKSVLKRNFSFMTILGFSCAVLATWEAMLMSFAPDLTNGGPAGLVYGFLFVWIGNLSVFATLCELVSMAPTSGGQYHWVAMLAPRSNYKFLSYITGWLTIGGWQGTAACTAYLVGSMTQGLVHFVISSYDPQKYQATLITWLCVFLALLINTVVGRMLPKLEGIILICHILGFFAILITLLSFGTHAEAEHVFLEFRNGGGWPTQTLSWFVGLIGCVYSFTGVDCSFHMSEEVKNPSITVPRSIMISVFINGLMGFAMLIAMLFAATDIDKALNSDTGYPCIEIFYEATHSVAGTAIIATLVITLIFFAVVGVLAATSRLFWAFARDRGLPFWRTLSKVDDRVSLPVWAVAITSLVSCLLCIINIGSTVAYSALVSVSVSGLYSSYLMAAGMLLYRRCGKGIVKPDPNAPPAPVKTYFIEGQLAWGPWHIPGVFGIINNTYACVYLLVVFFFSFWPQSTPTTAETMNFTVVMTGSLLAFSIIYYLLKGKKEYQGPFVEI